MDINSISQFNVWKKKLNKNVENMFHNHNDCRQLPGCCSRGFTELVFLFITRLDTKDSNHIGACTAEWTSIIPLGKGTCNRHDPGPWRATRTICVNSGLPFHPFIYLLGWLYTSFWRSIAQVCEPACYTQVKRPPHNCG